MKIFLLLGASLLLTHCNTTGLNNNEDTFSKKKALGGKVSYLKNGEMQIADNDPEAFQYISQSCRGNLAKVDPDERVDEKSIEVGISVNSAGQVGKFVRYRCE